MIPDPTVPAATGAGLGRVATDSAVGSLWTTVSRLTGLLRVVVVAAVLGPTHFADLYTATNQLPSLSYELLTGALLISMVVPSLVQHLDRGRPADAERAASRFLTLAVLAALGVAAAVSLAGPVVVDVLTIGVPGGTGAAGDGRAWALLALLMLQVPLYLVAGMGAAVQNAAGRFALAAAAPCAENIGIVAVLVGYAAVFGTGAAGTHGPAEVLLLGAGTTGAVLLHAAVQWAGARRCGVRLRPRGGGRRDPAVRELLQLVRPSLGYAGATTVRYLTVLVVVAAVPGGVVAFTMAYAFYNVPVALAARPIAQATLPGLSRAARDGGATPGGVPAETFADTFRRSASLVLLLAVPVAVGYVLLSGPLATLVAFGEMAGEDGRAALEACLLGLGAGVVGECAVVLGTQAAYARRDAARPLRAVLLRSGLAVAGLGAAATLLDGTALLTAAAASIAASDLVAGALLCWWVVRDRTGPDAASGRRLWRGTVGRPLVAGAATVPPVLLVLALTGTASGQAAALGQLALAGVAGLVAYLAAHRALGSPELGRLVALLRSRRPAGAGRG